MIYQTRLWHFYWERLGYENLHIPEQRPDVERDAEGSAPAAFRELTEPQPTRGLQAQSPRSTSALGET